MGDHININEPRRFDSDWSRMVEVAKLKLELEWANKRAEKFVDDLEAIFNRIKAGQTSELHYSNGEVIEIGAIGEKTDG